MMMQRRSVTEFMLEQEPNLFAYSPIIKNL